MERRNRQTRRERPDRSQRFERLDSRQRIDRSEAIKQRNIRRKKANMNRYFILVLALLLISLAVVIGQRRKISELNASYKEQVESQQRLKARVDALQNEIKQVNTLEYIEKKAREDLGMIKENEKIYIQDKGKNTEEKEKKAESQEVESQEGEKAPKEGENQ